MDLVPFYGQDHKKQKGYGTRYQSFYRLQNIWKNSFFSDLSLSNFDDLIQSGSEFFQKLPLLIYVSQSTASQLFQFHSAL